MTAPAVPPPTSPAVLLDRLERLPLSAPHRKLRRLGGFGYFFDTFDGTIMGAAMAIVIALWNVDAKIAGWLLSSVFIGYLIGALGAGILADRVGRRKLLVGALIVFTVFSGLMATAQSPTELFIWRMLSGIGLGAESVLVVPYLSEFVPARFRGPFLGRTVAFFGYGSLLASLVAVAVLAPNAGTWWGWRIAGVLAILPVLLLLFLRRGLPESPRYLISRGRIDEARAVVEQFEREAGVAAPSVEELAAMAQTTPGDIGGENRLSLREQLGQVFAKGIRRRTIIIWLLWFTLTGVNYGFASWMVNLLMSAKGYSATQAFLFSLVGAVVTIGGYHLASWMVGKVEKKWVIAVFAFVAAIGAVGVATADNTALLVASMAVMGAFLNGSAAAYYSYTSELYPTAVRTTGVGFASAAGRIGAILSPVAIGYVFAAAGFTTVFLGLVGVLLVGVLITVIFGERTNGLSLEAIEQKADLS